MYSNVNINVFLKVHLLVSELYSVVCCKTHTRYVKDMKYTSCGQTLLQRAERYYLLIY